MENNLENGVLDTPQDETPTPTNNVVEDKKEDYSSLLKRIESIEKNYFKSQGKDGEELETALKSYRETLNKDKIKLEEDNKNKDLRISELEQLLNAANQNIKQIENEKVIGSLFDELKVLKASREDLLTLTKISDEDYTDGKLDKDKVSKKMNEVLKRNPSFIRQDRPSKSGFYQDNKDEGTKVKPIPQKPWNKFR